MAVHRRMVDYGFTPERHPEGTHICFLYNSEIDRRAVIHPFVRAGLEDREDVNYFADASPPELLQRAEDERVLEVLTQDQLNHLRVTDATSVYCPDGRFDPAAMLDRLKALYAQITSHQAAGCRATGEMTWALRGIPGSDRLLEYEQSINTILDTNPLTVVCQYDTEQFDGETLVELLNVHPLIIVQGQIMRNQYYTTSDSVSDGQSLGIRASDVYELGVADRLLLAHLIISGLPTEVRIAEFARSTLLQVPGIGDAYIYLAGGGTPPEMRWSNISHMCTEAEQDPNSLDVAAIERETGANVLLIRTTSHLLGVVLIDVADAVAYSPFRYSVVNFANSVAIALEAKSRQAELRVWPERVARLERRLWRNSREVEGAGTPIASGEPRDPYSLPGVSKLSERQWGVLTMLLQGERVPRIATSLFLSQSTVRNHLADIFKKFGVHSQDELLDLFRADSAESSDV